MTKIAHATKNEIGTITGGQLGDQTGLEVMVQDFFEYDWTLVFRPKNPTIADKMAKYAEIIAENDHVGYGQGSDRYTMYLQAKSLSWNFEAISTDCATDCSQMMATICIACGMEVSPYMYTGNEYGCLNGTGEFDALPYEKGMDLRRGDILLTTVKGHTAIVVEGSFPNHIPKWVGEAYGLPLIPVYQSIGTLDKLPGWPMLAAGNLFDVCDEILNYYFIRIAGEYFGWVEKPYVLRKTPASSGSVTSAVHIRTNPGANYKSIGILEKGATVQICDTKEAANGAAWYYVRYKDGFGFSSSKYIKTT
jgi:hypothetical protein